MYQIGEKVHQWTILAQVPATYESKPHWHVRCVCGVEKTLPAFQVQRNQSCGCFRKTRVTGDRSPLFKHGDADLTFYRSYEKGAVARNISFLLSIERFKLLVQQPCFYCGSPPQPRKLNHRTLNRNGVDRLDPILGYSTKNCVACCSECNYAKQSMTAEEFVTLCRRVVKHCVA